MRDNQLTGRWYGSDVISIGAQCGGPEDDGLSDIKIDLWKLFCKHCKQFELEESS